MAPKPQSTRGAVAASLLTSPIIGVVRTNTLEEATAQARALIGGGIELVEITFTVPRGPELVADLLGRRVGDGPPWIGMGTVTDGERAEIALAAGAEFLVSPNVEPEVAEMALQVDRFLVLGALSSTEIVLARRLGADIVKVYPLPPVGGPTYLSTVRGPLGTIPMLAAGGFPIDEIPAYLEAGASAFGIGAPLLGCHDEDRGRETIRRALALARSEEKA